MTVAIPAQRETPTLAQRNDSLERQLDRLAVLAQMHADMTKEIRRNAAELVNDGASWNQVSTAIGCSRIEAKERYMDFALLRQLQRAGR